MPRTLIFGTSYIADQQAKWLLQQWAAVTRKLNPDADMLVIDSASPVQFRLVDLDIRSLGFTDNVGHLSRTGRDGWGRAFCFGLETALREKYDYAVHIECDLLFARPVAPIIKRMAEF